ncbi:MAG: alpha/beta hydrolase [Nodosilinea sp.]
MALPLRAAEEIFLDFGPLSRSVPTSAVAAFAADGLIDQRLAPFLRRLNPDQRAELRAALVAAKEADLIPLSQWFNTPMGARTLVFAGKLVQTTARLNGQQALRAALVASAAEDGDISVLDIARNFPTLGLRLDLDATLRNARQIRDETNATQTLVELVKQQSTADAALPPGFDPAGLPDLTQPGPYAVRQVPLTLYDSARDRTYPADVFLPDDLSAIRGTMPVVAISHGLGDSRASFYDVARHAASYGLAVTLPDHIGSNLTQREAMLAGLSNETFKAAEFLDRPLDISFLLDELERNNASDFQGKLDLNQVSVVGHSFGGYTALALAGATINFDRLAQRCDVNTNIMLDAALVLECRALELLDNPVVADRLGNQGIRDERVKIIMAFAPVANLFGQRGISQIKIPVMMFGGALDILTPVVPQQVSVFNWLTTPEKYFYLGENSSHSAGTTRLITRLLRLDQDFEQGIDDGLALSRGVNKSLVVAFSHVYLSGQQEYQPFLGAAYVETVSIEPFRFHLVRELPAPVRAVLEAYTY